jgi:hemerythrin superfamily protein
MDAIELLEKDHDKVENFFTQIEQGVTPVKGKTLFKNIYHELAIHAIVEEQVFYPAIAAYPQFKSMLKDAFSEHAEVKQQLGDIAYMEPASDEWNKMMLKVWEEIKHHISDEEEKLFPKVREVMSEKELKTLGAELKLAKSSNLDSDLLSQPLGFAKEAETVKVKAS